MGGSGYELGPNDCGWSLLEAVGRLIEREGKEGKAVDMVLLGDGEDCLILDGVNGSA